MRMWAKQCIGSIVNVDSIDYIAIWTCNPRLSCNNEVISMKPFITKRGGNYLTMAFQCRTKDKVLAPLSIAASKQNDKEKIKQHKNEEKSVKLASNIRVEVLWLTEAWQLLWAF